MVLFCLWTESASFNLPVVVSLLIQNDNIVSDFAWHLISYLCWQAKQAHNCRLQGRTVCIWRWQWVRMQEHFPLKCKKIALQMNFTHIWCVHVINSAARWLICQNTVRRQLFQIYLVRIVYRGLVSYYINSCAALHYSIQLFIMKCSLVLCIIIPKALPSLIHLTSTYLKLLAKSLIEINVFAPF